jgi:hypothetical protein
MMMLLNDRRGPKVGKGGKKLCTNAQTQPPMAVSAPLPYQFKGGGAAVDPQVDEDGRLAAGLGLQSPQGLVGAFHRHLQHLTPAASLDGSRGSEEVMIAGYGGLDDDVRSDFDAASLTRPSSCVVPGLRPSISSCVGLTVTPAKGPKPVRITFHSPPSHWSPTVVSSCSSCAIAPFSPVKSDEDEIAVELQVLDALRGQGTLPTLRSGGHHDVALCRRSWARTEGYDTLCRVAWWSVLLTTAHGTRAVPILIRAGGTRSGAEGTCLPCC